MGKVCLTKAQVSKLETFDSDKNGFTYEELKAAWKNYGEKQKKDDKEFLGKMLNAAGHSKPEMTNLRRDFFSGLYDSCNRNSVIVSAHIMHWRGGAWFVKGIPQVTAIVWFHNLSKNEEKNVTLQVHIKRKGQADYVFHKELKGQDVLAQDKGVDGRSYINISLPGDLHDDFSLKLNYTYNGKVIKSAVYDYIKRTKADSDGNPRWKTDPVEKVMRAPKK